MEEIWKDVPQYEGMYQVSTKGRVRSLDRTYPTKKSKAFHKKGKVMSPNINNSGYYYLCLCNGKKHWYAKLHRIVAATFIPNPDNLPEVNHINGNKLDNSVENLEWCNHSDNHKHSYRIGLSKIEIAQRAKRKKVVQIDPITGVVIKEWSSVIEAERFFNKTNPRPTNICRCVNGYNKIAYGYKWRYKE